MAVAIRITPPRVIKWTAMAILVLVYSLRLRNVPELITLGRSSRKGPKTRKKKTQLMTLGRGTRILRLSPGTDYHMKGGLASLLDSMPFLRCLFCL